MKDVAFAVGDRWLYQEHTNAAGLPAELEDYEAAEDVVHLSIGHADLK